MKTDIITVDEYTPLDEAKKIMSDNAIGSLPVVNQNKLVGLITHNDF
jgi:acetoin utilization protein AcuB